MSYRTLLFAIDDEPLAEAQVDHAAQLARASEGRLVGLSCHRPTPWPRDGAVGFIEGDPLTIELRAAEEAAVARETVFLQRCRLAGLTASDAILDPAEMASAVCRHAMVQRRIGRLLQIDLERFAVGHHGAGTDGVQRAQHAALAPQCLVGEADDQAVRRSDR